LNLYETDEEKVEAIKKWWKDNGTSVIAGVAIGLGAVFGWGAWVNYQEDEAQQASAAFEQLAASADSGDPDEVRQQSELLMEDYPSTPYAALGSLIRARVELEAGDRDAARASLELAIEKAPDPAIARVAALRLARVLIAGGDLEGAAAVIERHDKDGSFRGDFDALRGDIAAAQGEVVEARDAYARAIAAGAANASLLQLKIDNLPPAS
jgi:predicted negative regulator of RcsB-dependent stress response